MLNPSHNKRQVKKFGLSILLFLLFLIPPLSQAAIREITLFPNSARIDETMKIQAQGSPASKNQVSIVLPSQADVETLMVTLPSTSKVKIEDISVKSSHRVDENRIAQLRGQIKKLKADKKEMEAKIHALDAQIQFWQAQPKAKTKTVPDADNLSAAIGRNIRKLYHEKHGIEADYPKIDKQMKELEELLNQAVGQKESVWEAVILLSGSLSNDSVLNYSYTVGGCGWKPLYRLEAVPLSQNVLFAWDAEIWQSTGRDWKDAQIHLATIQPPKTITPPDLPPWQIRPKTPVVYKAARKPSKSATESLKTMDMEDAVQSAIPTETVHATYSVWTVGEKTVPAGSRQRVKIRQDIWPAAFYYVARPSLSPQAFLQAKVKLDHSVEIPPGTASFIIDGAMIGKREFALAGSETDIFFGVSPFITVNTSTLADQTGTTAFLQNKQTRKWHWKIEAKNASRSPITLRLEEPIPQARDERIKLSFHHRPQPQETDQARWVWVMELPALQKKVIETTIDMEAPKDMDLDFGWRK
jgi:uncharacterized protein (TIGR02231 family)